MRSIKTITQEIKSDWKKPYFGAVPYIEAMETLESVTDKYIVEEGSMIIRYFLANAQTWRGETARRIKRELNDMIK